MALNSLRLLLAFPLFAFPLAGCTAMQVHSQHANGGELTAGGAYTAEAERHMQADCPYGYTLVDEDGNARREQRLPTPPDTALAFISAEAYLYQAANEHHVRYECNAAPAPRGAPPSTRPAAGRFPIAAAASTMKIAAEWASGCGDGDGPARNTTVRVSFAPTGAVTEVEILDDEVRATPVGACMVQRFRTVTVPPFTGDVVTVRKRVVIAAGGASPSTKL